jgi:hypothetical protein
LELHGAAQGREPKEGGAYVGRRKAAQGSASAGEVVVAGGLLRWGYGDGCASARCRDGAEVLGCLRVQPCEWIR